MLRKRKKLRSSRSRLCNTVPFGPSASQTNPEILGELKYPEGIAGNVYRPAGLGYGEELVSSFTNHSCLAVMTWLYDSFPKPWAKGLLVARFCNLIKVDECDVGFIGTRANDVAEERTGAIRMGSNKRMERDAENCRRFALAVPASLILGVRSFVIESSEDCVGLLGVYFLEGVCVTELSEPYHTPSSLEIKHRIDSPRLSRSSLISGLSVSRLENIV